jgi:uncharacterized protein (TIGR02172 family)
MSLTTSILRGGKLVAALHGRITAQNAPDVEAELMDALAQHPGVPVEIDCDDLEYLSSAGLRVMLRLRKSVEDLSIVNVSPDVYDVFDMTGFTMMMEVRRAYRTLSVEGCPVIGKGAKGVLYRIDPETVCKVSRNPDSLDDINRERELARAAFVAGIPTAISYDVVRVGEGYGSVFELLNADTMGDLLARGDWSVERVAEASAELLTQMSSTKVDPKVMPSILVEAQEWVELLHGVVDDGTYARLRELVAGIPEEPFMVHGDFHVHNVMVQADEPLLIDMDTLSHGNGVFDLESAYSAYVGRGLLDQQSIEHFIGVPYETSCHLWDLILRGRFPEAGEDELRAKEDRVRLLSALRLMGRPRRHKDIDPALAERTYEVYGAVIRELLPKVDSLAV